MPPESSACLSAALSVGVPSGSPRGCSQARGSGTRSVVRGSPDSRLLSGERTLLTFLFSEKSRLFI